MQNAELGMQAQASPLFSILYPTLCIINQVYVNWKMIAEAAKITWTDISAEELFAVIGLIVL